MANAQLLVSCIMPTYNRRFFVPQAIEYFMRQDYDKKELIIVDDGDDVVGDLVPDDERIRYIRLQTKMTVGAKRNLACEQARVVILRIGMMIRNVALAPLGLALLVERNCDNDTLLSVPGREAGR